MLKLRFCAIGSCRWTVGRTLNQESRRNAGHSKWANIKHTKALKDGQKSAMFTKIGRMMRVAIVEGRSSDPGSNVALARAMEYARRCSMPAASVASVIRGAAAAKEASRPAVIDFRGPGNCLIVADVLTDNLPKTRQGLSTILRKNNERWRLAEGDGTEPTDNPRLALLAGAAHDLGAPAAAVARMLAAARSSTEPARSATLDFRGPGNCVIVADVVSVNLTKTRQLVLNILRKNNGSYADGTSRHVFDVKGVVLAAGVAEGSAEDHAIEAGAEDVAPLPSADGGFRFVCALESLPAVSARLAELGWTIRSADTEFVPHSLVTLSDEQLAAASALCDKLQESPDIVRLYDNIA